MQASLGHNHIVLKRNACQGPTVGEYWSNSHNQLYDRKALCLNDGVGVDMALEIGGTPTLLQCNATAKKGIIGRQNPKT